MALDLSAYNAPIATLKKTTHATAGNLDVLTLPTWCKVLTILAAGTGTIKLTYTGAQNAAIGTDYFPIAAGGSLKLKAIQLGGYPLRITSTVNSDPICFILESAIEAL